MSAALLLAFWAVSISLVLVPGADWAYAIAAGLRERAIAPAIAGMLLGYLAITLVVAAGVGALVTRHPELLTLMSLAGAAYLLWLGAQVIRHPAVPEAGQGAAGRAQDWVRRGFLVSGMNPKALLLMLALLPQFTRAQAPWAVELQIGALGLVQMLNCAVVYSLVAVASRLVLRTRPAAARRVSRLSGVAMIAVAALLLAEQMARHACL